MRISFAKKSLSTVAVAAITAATVALPSSLSVANAATSGYSDAEQLGRNMIGEETYPALNPTATGGEKTAKVGDSIEYKYTVNTGFPSDPDGLVSQRWIKFNVCQDPKAPFNAEPTAAQLGLSTTSDFSISKTDDNCWTVVAGSEYAKDGDYAPNRAWYPPATLDISIPATVKEKPADGSSLTGSINFLSGRLAETDPEQTLYSTFVRNNQDGTCVAETTSELTFPDLGYWVGGAKVFSDPRYQRYYSGVSRKIEPELLSGSVTVNDAVSGSLEADTWSAYLYDTNPGNEFEEDTQIGHVVFKSIEDTPYYAAEEENLWVSGTESKAVAQFQSTYPCDPGVSTLDENLIAAGYYALGLKVDFDAVRPPEDASASADFIIKFDEPEFQVEKSAKQSSVTVDEDNSFTADYTIKVTNVGEVAGTFEDLTDNLSDSLPAGFTGEVSPKTIAGEELEPGASKEYTVTLNGQVDPAAASANNNAGWVAAGQCDTTSGTDGVGDKTKGLYNQVIMGTDNSADADGIANNDACVTVEKPEPKFAVAKSTNDQAVTITGSEETTIERTYTVTVTNTGKVAGTSNPVTDTPAEPTGFAISKVVVDDVEVTGADGTYEVTSGDELEPGKSKEHTVVVTYTVTPRNIDADGWNKLSQCKADGDSPDSTMGIYNKVTMEGDSDGEDNNDACTPVNPTTTFAVKKELADSQEKTITVADDNTFTVDYKITVTNTGSKAGTFPEVKDVPTLPTGFEVESIDPETIPGEELAAGESKTYELKMKGKVHPQSADWDAASVTCSNDGEGDPTKGLFNKVTMDADSDGPENNHACVNVEKPTPKFKVEKNLAAGQENPVVVGADNDFTVNYVITVTNTGLVAGTFEDLTDKLSDQLPAGFSGEMDKTTIPGEELAPGESKDYTVVLTGKVDRAQAAENNNAGWKNASVCDTTSGVDGQGDKTKGLYNQVIMGTDNSSDGDGIANNDACVPVKTPEEPPVTPPVTPSTSATTVPSTSTPTLPLPPVSVPPTVPTGVSKSPTSTPTTSTPQSKGKGILANTGASVLGLVGLATLLSIAGFAALIRKKKES